MCLIKTTIFNKIFKVNRLLQHNTSEFQLRFVYLNRNLFGTKYFTTNPTVSRSILMENHPKSSKRSAKSVAGVSNNKIRRVKDSSSAISCVANNNLGNCLKNPMDTSAPATAKPPLTDAVRILETPEKSQSDKKSYRVIELSNGLKAVLISDPSPIDADSNNAEASATDTETEEEVSDDDDAADDDASDGDADEDSGSSMQKLAACSLCVDVGSFSDPRDIQGLAHFLEHMIFMGSEKYTSENEFDVYIKKCGGSDNAFTNCEETQFYFEVGEKHLDGAFDRFASQFKYPLMLKEAMTRERDAVESEFTSKGQDDGVRREQLLVGMGRPEHPCSIFAWGNHKTLKDNIDDDRLYERVHEFWRRHYSAHRMYLSVQARMSLDELQDLVIKHWSDVKNNQLPGDDLSSFNNRNAFADDFSSKLLLHKPVANSTRLEVAFCLPSVLQDYIGKSHHFIAYFLGHEGTGSLCAYLRNKLYSMDLVAGVDEPGFTSNSLFSIFTIVVHLTQFGLENVRDVVAAIFGYIRFLKAADLQESHYREIQQIEANHFRFKTEQTPVDNVEQLASNLKYYPPKYINTGNLLYMEYQPDKIEAILNALTDPETPLNIMLSTAQPFNGSTFDRVEPWFGTEYATVDFPEGWRELRANAKILPDFALPAENVYITTDFDILFKKDVTKVSEYPVKVYESDVGELWFRQDSRFLLPVSYFNFYLQSPLFRGTTENLVMASIYPVLLKFAMVERLYPATIAGLGYEIFTSEKGLIIQASGYSQKLHRVVETLSAALTTFAEEVTEEKFRTIVEQKLRDYYNVILKPKSFAKILRINIVDEQYVNTLEKFEHLKMATLANFKQFARELSKELRVQALFQGNLTADQASSIMSNFMERIKCGPLIDGTRLKLRTNKLPDGSSYLRYPSMNQADTNTVTVNYYQIGPISIRLNCFIDLMLLIADEPLYNILRSKEQLGYDVGCALRDNNGILGYTITIVSAENKFTSEHIDDRIEAFRAMFIDIVKNLSPKDFNQYLDTLIKTKMTEDNDLREELNRNWAEVTTDEYIFDRHAKEVACLKTITQDELTEFCVENFATSARKLSVQVIGSCDLDAICEKATADVPSSIFAQSFKPLELVEFSNNPDRGVLIKDIDEFKRSMEVYPVSKTIV